MVQRGRGGVLYGTVEITVHRSLLEYSTALPMYGNRNYCSQRQESGSIPPTHADYTAASDSHLSVVKGKPPRLAALGANADRVR